MVTQRNFPVVALAVLWLMSGVCMAAPLSEFIHPDEIVPGMRGYGLTVFEGTEPETFVVEARGVMKNSFPKQDLVIIVMDDPRLRESNVTAGMSGSPIYFDGRMLGALAYGPTFSKKPIAYVTPIQNMLMELDRPAEPVRPWQRLAALGGMWEGATDGGAHAAGVRAAAPAGAVSPVSTALSVSGFGTKRISQMANLFSPYGLIPVAGGSGSGTASGSASGPSKFIPGSAVGVQMMTGDLSMTAIGTVTYVDPKGRVLAFGHPFMNIGQTAMPATTARVHMFMPSTMISYKLASPLQVMGSMVQDRQPAILIDPTRPAPMVPVTVSVENVQTGRRETYRYRIVREKGLTTILAFIGLMETLDVTEAGAPMDRSFFVRARIRLAGRELPVEITDLTPIPIKTLFDLMMLLDNGIEEAVPAELEFDVRVRNAAQTAWIVGARTERRTYRPGDRVAVKVRLRGQSGDETTVDAGLTLPKNIPGRVADIEVRGGFGFSQPEAMPQTIGQVIRLLEGRPKGSDVLVRAFPVLPSLAQGGEPLPDLPAFYQRLVLGGVQNTPQVLVRPSYETYTTEWIVLGSQRLQVEIEPEGRP